MKKQKGSTIVEVLVSLIIILIAISGFFISYFSLVKIVNRQKEYIYFEKVCLDINKYSNKYKKDWDIYYFDNVNSLEYMHIVYYDANFKKTTILSKYQLVYYYDRENNLIISIKNLEDDYYIIEQLNYGSVRYE